MDNYQNEFDQIEDAAADRRRTQEFDDLQSEVRGDDIGRISRFLSPEARQILLDKRNGKQSAYMNALDLLLLNNPEYAEAYENTMNVLGKAEDAAERALIKLEQQLDIAEGELRETLNSAVTLSNGTRVFRDGDGKIWDEYDNPINKETAASIEWHGSKPSYETYLEQRKSVQRLQSSIHEVRVYQTDVLGSAREQLTDFDNPIKSPAELKEAAENIQEQMPEAVRVELQEPEPISTHDSISPSEIIELKI